MAVNARKLDERIPLLTHGAMQLPEVEVDSYSLEVQDDDGFAGDKANKGAFTEILEGLRETLRKVGEDPLGSKPSRQISRKKLDALLKEGEPAQAAVVQSAIEDFAQQLMQVVRRFLKLKSWRDTQAIVIGGGFSDCRVGELAIARAHILAAGEDLPVEIQLLKGDPDEQALIGTAHLLPAWMLQGHEAMLAADIGGTNIRVGIVELNLQKAPDLSKARVLELEHWCHRQEKDLKRDEAIERIAEMLSKRAADARKKNLRLAPVVGVGCPGTIQKDGSISKGAQNLPGNWESSAFRLPEELGKHLPRIGEHAPMVVLHNDAVVQGLSQLPRMLKWQHWGVLTIGTGLGNAHFSERTPSKD